MLLTEDRPDDDEEEQDGRRVPDRLVHAVGKARGLGAHEHPDRDRNEDDGEDLQQFRGLHPDRGLTREEVRQGEVDDDRQGEEGEQ